jgi:DNA end-binding protein Ku
VLTLTTMLFGDEVLPPDRLDELDTITEAEATPRELAMAEQLIGTLSAEFEPDKYHDEYRERVLELIERKAAGETVTVEPQAEEPAAAPDLMAALEASLAAVRSDGGADPDEPAPPSTPAATSKPAAPSKPAAKRSRSRSSGKSDGATKTPAKAKAKR